MFETLGKKRCCTLQPAESTTIRRCWEEEERGREGGREGGKMNLLSHKIDGNTETEETSTLANHCCSGPTKPQGESGLCKASLPAHSMWWCRWDCSEGSLRLGLPLVQRAMALH